MTFTSLAKNILSALFCTIFVTLSLGQSNSKFNTVQIGVITYSYRSMPASLEELLLQVKGSEISGVELMGGPVEAYLGAPTDKKALAEWRATVPIKAFKPIRKMFKKAGIEIYAFKPSALGPDNTDEEIAYALKAAKKLGARSVTVELPKDTAHSARLGRIAKKHKVLIGYHNHLQGNDEAWKTALQQSKYNSINLDCGHYIAAGGNNTRESLLSFIAANHQRISSIHLKDRTTQENGALNLPWGQGDTPIHDILTLLRDKKYRIPVTIELEHQIPEHSNAVEEVRKSKDFAKEILSNQHAL